MRKTILLLALLPTLICASENAQDNYNVLLTSYQKQNWQGLIEHAKDSFKEYPDSPFLSDIYFFTGVAYFNKGDFGLANMYFSNFLQKYATPKYFEEAIIYKFKIAEEFEKGAGKHLLGWEQMPQWASAYDDALELYDEVLATLPNHEIAAKALANKSRMQRKEGKYKESIDQYQTLIRRFPKNPLAPEAYLNIAQIYFEQSRDECPSADYLELAKVNLRKFKNDFPSDNKVSNAEAMMQEMQDEYAKDLWNSAIYFDKKQKKVSAELYLRAIVQRYPDSSFAKDASEKLSTLKSSSPDKI